MKCINKHKQRNASCSSHFSHFCSKQMKKILIKETLQVEKIYL